MENSHAWKSSIQKPYSTINFELSVENISYISIRGLLCYVQQTSFLSLAMLMSYFTQKRLYSPNFGPRSYPRSSSDRLGQINIKKKAIFRLLAFFVFFVVVFGFRFTRNILIGLPDVTKINDMVFNEATLIEDRN